MSRVREETAAIGRPEVPSMVLLRLWEDLEQTLAEQAPDPSSQTRAAVPCCPISREASRSPASCSAPKPLLPG